MEADPYQPPQVEESAEVRVIEVPALRELVLGWERLRAIYNALLFLPGVGILCLLAIQSIGLGLGELFFVGLIAGISANVAFCLGPITELYARALLPTGIFPKCGRNILFMMGLGLSAIVFLWVAVSVTL